MWRKVLFFSAVLSVIFVFPFAMQAAVSTSVDLSGGYVEDLIVGPDGNLLALTMSPNGAWVSTDGASYTGPDATTHDMGNCTSGGADADYFYVDCGIEIYRSSDGSTWDQLGLTNVNQYMYADNNRVVQVMRKTGDAGYMTLAISEDQGENWTEDIEVVGVSDFLFMDFAGDTGYALANVNDTYWIYKTVDGGYNWSTTSYSFSYAASLSITVKGSNGNHVALQLGDDTYISIDGGVNFTDTGLVGGGEVVFDGTRLYSGMNYSDDLGSNWTVIEQEGIDLGGTNLAVDGNTMLVDSGLGTAYSADGGTTWAELIDGMEALEVEQIVQKTGDRDKVLLALYGGVGISDDFLGARNWTLNTDIGSTTAVFYGVDIALAAGGGDIYYSTDDAATWNSTAPAGGTVTDFIRNQGTYYASYEGGVIYSSDGITWSDFGLSGYSVNALAKTSAGKLYAAVGSESSTTGSNSGIYKYNGTSWNQIYSGGYYTDVEVADNDKGINVVYAVSAVSENTEFGEVIISTDYGTTWDDLTANGLATDGWFHQVVAQGNDENALYISTARPAGTGKIYKTLDGGDTWSLFHTGLKDQTFEAMYWDDLMVGSNAGLMNVNSEAKIKVTRNKKKVKKGNRVKLTVKLTDKDTGDVLSNKPIKLYRRDNKDSGTWKLLKTKKTGPKGKTSFWRTVNKKTYWKVVWKPKKSAVKRAYGSGNNIARTNSKLK